MEDVDNPQSETGKSVASPLEWSSSAERPRTRWRVPASLGLLLFVIGAGWGVSRLINSATPAVDLPLAGRLALLPFENRTADTAESWIEIGLMEMVVEAVSKVAGPAVVSPDRLRRALAPRELNLSDPAARERARELAMAAGADQVLDARIIRQGESFAIEMELFDASGMVSSSRVEDATLLAAADALVFAIARGLAAEGGPRQIATLFSRSPFFDRLYGTGVQELRTRGPRAARPYFEIALQHRPEFLQAKAMLAECARRMGELEPARELTQEQLFEAQSRGNRTLEARSLRVLALLAALDGELEKAQTLYSQAFTLHLDMADQPARAEVLYELARLALADNDSARAEELYVELLGLQQDLGDRLGEADTLFQIGSLLLATDDLDGAAQVLTDARDLSLQTADVWTEMRISASLGEVAQRQGDIETAKTLWRRAVAFYDQRQENARRLLLSYNLAEALVKTGEFDEAEDRFHSIRELAVELGNESYEAKASLGLSWLLLRSGYPYQAKPHLDRVLELDHWLDDRVLLQLVIAWYAYEQGNYTLAVNTQLDVKQRSTERWAPIDEAFLAVYQQAEILGRRLPLPGEEGYSQSESD